MTRLFIWELGYAYRFAGMLEQSLAECQRARQIDPSVKANGSVLNTYLYLGEYDNFLQSLPDVNGSAFTFRFYRGFGEYHLEESLSWRPTILFALMKKTPRCTQGLEGPLPMPLPRRSRTAYRFCRSWKAKSSSVESATRRLPIRLHKATQYWAIELRPSARCVRALTADFFFLPLFPERSATERPSRPARICARHEHCSAPAASRQLQKRVFLTPA